jgi:hypothetical protein
MQWLEGLHSPSTKRGNKECLEMRRRTTLAIIIIAVMAVSASAVFSHPGWRGGQKQLGYRHQVWDKDKLVTLEGEITDAERPVITIEAYGKEYILHAGPRWFWQEKEYNLKSGQAVKVTGMVAEVDGKLNLYPSVIETEGKSIVLAHENGIPAWAGRGQRFGRGQDRFDNKPGYGWRAHGRMHGRAGRGGYRHGCDW